jgi:hypothetical protein
MNPHCSEFLDPLHAFPPVLVYTCMCCISFFSGKVVRMSFGSPPTQFSMRGGRRVDVMSTRVKEVQGTLQEQPRRQCIGTSQENVCTLIQREEVEEDLIETSDDESAKDETYKMSPMPQSENSAEDEIEGNESGVWDEAKEEEGMVEGTFNP